MAQPKTLAHKAPPPKARQAKERDDKELRRKAASPAEAKTVKAPDDNSQAAGAASVS
jgi:hypothetical protein